jgi:hypothetical protein
MSSKPKADRRIWTPQRIKKLWIPRIRNYLDGVYEESLCTLRLQTSTATFAAWLEDYVHSSIQSEYYEIGPGEVHMEDIELADSISFYKHSETPSDDSLIWFFSIPATYHWIIDPSERWNDDSSNVGTYELGRAMTFKVTPLSQSKELIKVDAWCNLRCVIPFYESILAGLTWDFSGVASAPVTSKLEASPTSYDVMTASQTGEEEQELKGFFVSYGQRPEKAKRNAQIYDEFKAGASRSDLATKYDLSAETIKTIVREERAKRGERPIPSVGVKRGEKG